MSSARRLAASALAVLLVGIPIVALVMLTGCRKEDEIFLDTNLPPNTSLTSAPAPYSQSNYRIHFYWDGTDPDGYIVGYYFAWDDTVASSWVWTARTDSLFKANIDTAGETRRHTFYIRAVDNEGKLDPTPARVRFDAWTVAPSCTLLYRLDGPFDPNSPNYDPEATGDTLLMGSPPTFVWSGDDPDGLGAPVQFSYRLDSTPFPAWSDVTTTTITGPISSGTHVFYVKVTDETGAESFPVNYRFVMNYDPDSAILTPPDPSGQLRVEDGTRIDFTWHSQDREELEGVEGGVTNMWIALDSGFIKGFGDTVAPYTGSWWFSSVTDSADHSIESQNLPTGGNRAHEFRVWAVDVEGRFETPSHVANDREIFKFWYNFPPTDEILSPAQGETVQVPFWVMWEGTDRDGEIKTYQFVLDPIVSSFTTRDTTSAYYDNVPTGAHEFWVRSQDASGCWALGYEKITFYVEEQ